MKLSQMEAAALKELASRKNMAVRLFRPLSHQEPIFEQPRSKYMLVTGGNRGGKTISLAQLCAAISMDEEIVFSDGSKRTARMPWQKGRPLKIWLVCIDARHIGDVIYPALFKAGMFKVAFDPETKQLRNYNPDKDPALGVKPKMSPPFIPARYIESFSWNIKADNIFNRVTIKNPATNAVMADIHAFTSMGDPPQGRAVDFIWVDEQLARQGYIDELKARLIDRDGQLAWTSWADEDNPELSKFLAMIDRETDAESGIAKKVELFLEDNKTLGKKAIADFRAGCATEEEWLQRNKGIAPSEKIRMYPLFDKHIHTALIDDPEDEDDLSRELKKTDGIPPDTWTKTLILDPGTQHPAVLVCAVPPPELGDYMVPYQEIYPGRADPMQLARIVKRQAGGQKFFRFLIDKRAGRQQTMGLSLGTRVVDAYQEAFEREGLTCVSTKHSFLFASDDVGGRQLVVQGWLHPGKSPYPRLRIVTHRCPNLCEQLRKVKKKVISRDPVDDRKARGAVDLVDALEYWAASNPKYLKLKKTMQEASPAYQRYMKRFGRGSEKRPTIQMGTYY